MVFSYFPPSPPHLYLLHPHPIHPTPTPSIPLSLPLQPFSRLPSSQLPAAATGQWTRPLSPRPFPVPCPGGRKRAWLWTARWPRSVWPPSGPRWWRGSRPCTGRKSRPSHPLPPPPPQGGAALPAPRGLAMPSVVTTTQTLSSFYSGPSCWVLCRRRHRASS